MATDLPYRDFSTLSCPMEGCTETLRLTWHSSYEFYASDVLGGPEIDQGDAQATTWEVGCGAGHVLLLPGELGCGCIEDCGHNEDDFDWSEDSRRFRMHDRERLRGLLERMAVAA